MQDKVCVITGGAGSIGFAAAKLLLAEGAKVMLTDLSEAALQRATGAIDGSMRASLATYAADVTKSDQVKACIAATVGRVGNKGAFLAAKHTLPVMNDGGSIVITSSIVGIKGDPGACAYITAKHAQVGLMRVLAKEAAARNIRVNTIHPGPVDNDFQLNVEQHLSGALGRNATQFFNDIIPLKRHARAEEIARSVLYLASDASSFTTGSLLMVDGGLSA